MKMSLQYKLLYSFMALIIVVLVGMSVGASTLIRDYFLDKKQQELVTQSFEIARVSNEFFEGHMNEEQFSSFLRNVDTLTGARVWVVDHTSRTIIMSDSRCNQVSQNENNAGAACDLGENKASFILLGIMDEFASDIDEVFHGKVWAKSYYHPYYRENMMMVAVPIAQKNDSIKGAVMLSAPAKGINNFLQRVYYYISVAGILALLLAIGVAHWLARGIVGPLKAMQKTAGAMAHGDYNTRVTIQSQDELEELGASLNTLAKELAYSGEQAEKLEKLRREFIANVSHELRTPLTVIRGYNEALFDGTVVDQEMAEKYHRMVRDETIRLERMIKDLLDLSRLQSGSMKMDKEKIPLSNLVDGVASMFGQRAEQAEIDLVVNTVNGIPDIWGNGDRLTQLLLILLDNALKFTLPGAKVRVETATEDDNVVLTVADTGIGIPAVDLPFIWERFYKVDKAHTRSKSGTGLGLAIGKEIIEMHEATVEVTSSPEQGTIFKIRFPLEK
jgi:signal transduction histidine kinase